MLDMSQQFLQWCILLLVLEIPDNINYSGTVIRKLLITYFVSNPITGRGEERGEHDFEN